jgi:hypothetical protein
MGNPLNELPHWTGEAKKIWREMPEDDLGELRFYGDPIPFLSRKG